MHLHGRYRLPLGLALSLHELQVRQSIADSLAVLLESFALMPSLISLRPISLSRLISRERETIMKSGSYGASYFGAMVHGQVVRGSVVNHVLLPHVIPPISQAPISLVPRIRVEIVHLVIDPGRHGIVKRLVVDVILIIAARIEVAARYRPVILVRALINTNYGRVIRFSRPFRRLKNGHVKSESSSDGASPLPYFVAR